MNVPIRARIYLAGPFFNDEQLRVQKSVEDLCEEYKQHYFSPRKELVLKPDANEGDRKKVFMSNVLHVKNSRLILANIEGNDVGTLWEMGAAFGYDSRVVAYSPNFSRRLNVMLAEAVDGYICGLDRVKLFLKGNNNKEKIGDLFVPEFNWSVVEHWKGDIQ